MKHLDMTLKLPRKIKAIYLLTKIPKFNPRKMRAPDLTTLMSTNATSSRLPVSKPVSIKWTNKSAANVGEEQASEAQNGSDATEQEMVTPRPEGMDDNRVHQEIMNVQEEQSVGDVHVEANHEIEAKEENAIIEDACADKDNSKMTKMVHK